MVTSTPLYGSDFAMLHPCHRRGVRWEATHVAMQRRVSSGAGESLGPLIGPIGRDDSIGTGRWRLDRIAPGDGAPRQADRISGPLRWLGGGVIGAQELRAAGQCNLTAAGIVGPCLFRVCV